MSISICLCGAAQNLAVEYIFEALPRVNFFCMCSAHYGTASRQDCIMQSNLRSSGRARHRWWENRETLEIILLEYPAAISTLATHSTYCWPARQPRAAYLCRLGHVVKVAFFYGKWGGFSSMYF